MTDLLVMPGIGQVHLNYHKENKKGEGYQSEIDKKTEKASPGYYSVFLEDSKVLAELTATERCGFHRYTFPASDSSHFVFDLKYLNTQKKDPCILASSIKIINDSTIAGYRLVTNWAPYRYFYFVAKFSKVFKSYGLAINDTIRKGTNEVNGKNVKAHFDFTTAEGEKILLQVGTSNVSIDGALKNLNAEIDAKSFEAIKLEAQDKWQRALMVVNAELADSSDKKMFYTSLYRTMLAPVIYCDVDSSYRGSDNQIHKGKHVNHHIFSLWDTFRAQHPLLTIDQPNRVNDIVNSMLAIFDESGFLPVWHFGSGENNCMIGLHSMPVIADAALKGFDGFDKQKALRAMLHDIHGNGSLYGIDSFKQGAGGVFTKDAIIYGTKLFHQYGYIPGDIANAVVSRTLEYSYNSYNVYQMASNLKSDTAAYYLKCAAYYKNLFDSETGFMRGKKSDGQFRSVPLDPIKQDHGWSVGDYYGDYVEGSAWQWLWFVPHDIPGLIELIGGKDTFESRLDAFFNPTTKGIETDEVSGYIGQYAQGNEPGHHCPYLYNFTNHPEKGQKIIRELMKTTYTPLPNGLCGNDDCGQMSAWYVFSALGFYPVNPSSGDYYFGTPLVENASISLEKGKMFKIKTKKSSTSSVLVKRVFLNGKVYHQRFIKHTDIVKGGELLFEME